MTTLDFSPLYRSTMGFDRLFDLLDDGSRPDWPPPRPLGTSPISRGCFRGGKRPARGGTMRPIGRVGGAPAAKSRQAFAGAARTVSSGMQAGAVPRPSRHRQGAEMKAVLGGGPNVDANGALEEIRTPDP